METATQNLWPDFVIEKTRSPKSILKEQAGYLMAKTNNVLLAEVRTKISEDSEGISICHDFVLIAPALGGYRYTLFEVFQGIIFYPLLIVFNEDETNMLHPKNEDETNMLHPENEEEFIEDIRKIFNHPDTVRIISSLLSQSLEK